MNYEILDSDKDSVKWEKTLRFLPNDLQDVYFYSEYVGMHKFLEGTKALMFTCSGNGNIWLHPFLLQPIDSDEFSIDAGPWFDIESAYGYGGPISNTKDKNFLKKANECFNQWCKENNIIASFIRFHPLLDNQNYADKNAEINYDRDTISQDLKNLDIDNLPFSGKVRNMIKRVDKANVKIEVYDPIKNFTYFKTLYLSTMSRIKADTYYYFSETYFSNLAKLVFNNGWLVGAVLKDKWVGAALFLKGSKSLHYHLSSTDPDCRIPGITNALIFKGMQLGKSKGCKVLHLGGGNSSNPNDSLFSFKQKMGDMSNKFFIGKQIYNNDIYFQFKSQWEGKYPDLKEKFNDRLLCYRYT